MRKPIPIIKGTKADPTLRAVPRKFYVHAWPFCPETEVANIANFIDSQGFSRDQIEVVKLQARGNYSSFKIGISEELKDKLLNPEVWPAGISVNKFKFPFYKNSKQEQIKSSSV